MTALRTAEAKTIALSTWYLPVADKRVFLADCDNRVTLVKIYNALNEMLDSVLIGRLSVYGTVLSFCRDLAADSIFNDVRTARMRIERAIPSTVQIAREFVRIWDPGEPKACRRCGDLGRLIKDCTLVCCFNCEQSSHWAEECEMPIMCTICLSVDHRERHCPYLLFSANVDSGLLQELDVIPPSLYANVARAPAPPPVKTTEKEKTADKVKGMRR